MPYILGALEDFGSCNDSEDESKQKAKPTPPKSLWDEEFLKEAAEKLQHSFQTSFSAGIYDCSEHRRTKRWMKIGEGNSVSAGDTPMTAEQLGQNIQSLANAMTEMTGAEVSPDMEFNSLFAQTLKQMSETPDASRVSVGMIFVIQV